MVATTEPSASLTRRKFKRDLRLKPPAQQLAWLQCDDVRRVLGAAAVESMEKEIHARIGTAAKYACSLAWVDAVLNGEPPAKSDPGRKHGVRLHLSRGESRICSIVAESNELRDVEKSPAGRWLSDVGGDNGVNMPPTRRWTPPQCVEGEDILDCMGVNAARYYSHPPSPSAVALRIIAAIGKRAAKRVRRRGRVDTWMVGAVE